MDRRILELLERTTRAKAGGLWLKPTALAYNLGATRQYVNERLIKLTEEGYVDRTGDGFYRISDKGIKFVRE